MNLVSAGLMMALVLSACRTEGPPAAARATPSPSSTPAPTTAEVGVCSHDANVTVLGQANIFGAGIDELPAPGGGGGGVPPPCVAIPAGASLAMVPRAEGTLSFTPLRAPDTHFHKCPGGREAVLAFGPDGDAGLCDDASYGAIEGAGIVSGITSKDRGGYLIGVFLPARGKEGPPPPSLDFERNYDFARIAPLLGQLFFIGDGRTVDERLQPSISPAARPGSTSGSPTLGGSAGCPASTTRTTAGSGSRSGSSRSRPPRPPFERAL